MSLPDGKNPEHRSNNAMMVFCTGAALCVLAYVLGIGAVIGAALSGGDPAIVVGSLIGAIGVALLGVIGFLMTIVGGVWMFVRVIADQSADAAEQRYRNIER